MLPLLNRAVICKLSDTYVFHNADNANTMKLRHSHTLDIF